MPMAMKTIVKTKKIVARFLANSGPTDDLNEKQISELTNYLIIMDFISSNSSWERENAKFI